MKKAKQQKKMTLNEIAFESKVAIRTVNRIFAGEDVRFSSLVAVLETLDLSIYIEKEVA
jgi:transcriptional regulator with XRE-family HTH domain